MPTTIWNESPRLLRELDVPDTLSWVDEERDVSAWLGNPMQREAFNKLYSVADRVRIADDPRINQDWDYLQASNNFRFMSTKNSGVGIDRGIYNGPFDAFTNYMNILGDFITRVNNLYPEDIDNEQLESLLTTIKNQGDDLSAKEKEVERLQAKIVKLEASESKLRAELDTGEKPKRTTRKAAAKKVATDDYAIFAIKFFKFRLLAKFPSRLVASCTNLFLCPCCILRLLEATIADE